MQPLFSPPPPNGIADFVHGCCHRVFRELHIGICDEVFDLSPVYVEFVENGAFVSCICDTFYKYCRMVCIYYWSIELKRGIAYPMLDISRMDRGKFVVICLIFFLFIYLFMEISRSKLKIRRTLSIIGKMLRQIYHRSVNHISNVTWELSLQISADYSTSSYSIHSVEEGNSNGFKSIQMSQNPACLVLVYINEISELLGGFLDFPTPRFHRPLYCICIPFSPDKII